MKRTFTLLVIASFVSFLFNGCLGNRTPNPVASYQYGDENMSHEALKTSISDIESKISVLQKTESGKTGMNVGMVVVGLLIFWPAFFFMDVSDDEKIEIQAYEKRKESLTNILIRKDSGTKEVQIEKEPADKPINEYSECLKEAEKVKSEKMKELCKSQYGDSIKGTKI